MAFAIKNTQALNKCLVIPHASSEVDYVDSANTMSHNFYRFFIGILLLIFLYFKLDAFLWGLIAVLLLEGLTPLRIPQLILPVYQSLNTQAKDKSITAPNACPPLGFNAERMMSLLLGLSLVVSYFLLNHMLWFVPWFIVFALVGSGASGFCPMLIVLKRLGFK